MRHSTSRGLRLLVAFSILGLVASSCAKSTTTGTTAATTKGAGPSSTGGGPASTKGITTNTKAGGTVIFAAPQEPKILNSLLGDGNQFANAMITKAVLPTMMIVQPDYSYADVVEDGPPKVDSTSPFKVTWKIKKEAKWDDGSDLTADDVKAVTDFILDKENDVNSTTGYDLISDFKVNDPKSFTVTFSEPFAPYRLLWSVSEFIFPKKAYDAFKATGGKGNDFMKDGISFSSAPFKFDSFKRGDNITLVKNDKYWGANKPALDKIIFKFVDDSQSVQALEAKEVDVIYPQPQIALLQSAKKIDFAAFEVNLGTTWEHIDFNLANKALADPAVRQALIYGTDRKTIADTIVKPLVDNKDVPPLGNVFYVTNQKEYKDAFKGYAFDQVKAEKLLEDAGWKKGADGIRAKGADKLSFRYATTTGNPARERQQNLIQQQWQRIGVEVKPDNKPSTQLFSTDVLRSGNWDIINFAYVALPDPGGANVNFRGDKCPKTVPGCTASDGNNYQQYKNDQVTDLLKKTDGEADPQKRADLYNQANDLIAKDVPVMPLYQKATFVMYNKKLANVVDNPTQEGPMWNSQFWALAA